MMFISVPKERLSATPALLVERLRSRWRNTGVYLILEGVYVQTDARFTSEHVLIGLDTDNVTPANELARAMQIPQSAITLWEAANVSDTVERAATFYEGQGQREVGAAIYRRYAEALPDDVSAQSNAGRFFLKIDHLHLARMYLSRARELAPEVPEVAVNYWVLLQKEHKQREAADLWKWIATRFPDHPAVRARPS